MQRKGDQGFEGAGSVDFGCLAQDAPLLCFWFCSMLVQSGPFRLMAATGRDGWDIFCGVRTTSSSNIDKCTHAWIRASLETHKPWLILFHSQACRFGDPSSLQMAEEHAHCRVLQHTLDEVKVTREDDQEPCVVCLDAVEEQAKALPCGHQSFDFLCLVSWLQEQTTCPLCKSQVRSVHYHCNSATDFKVYEVRQTPKVPPTGLSSHSPRNRPRRTFEPRPWGRDLTPRNAEVSAIETALLRRKHIYRHLLYSLHVGSNRLSRYTTLTPTEFNQDADLVSRARSFIRRELQIFEFLSPDNGRETPNVARRANNAEFLLEYIVAILKTVEIKGSSGQAESMLGDFIGVDNARLFLHELSSWLRSPYTRLQDWDRHVQYNESHLHNRTKKRSFGDSVPPPPLRDRNIRPQRSSAPVRRRTYHLSDSYVPDYSSNRRSVTFRRTDEDPD